ASTGTLVPHTELRVVCPSSGADLPPDQVGELWYRGPQVMLGYLDNDQATEDTTTTCGFLKTGDLGYIDNDGHVFVVDRLKELIKYKGHQALRTPDSPATHLLARFLNASDPSILDRFKVIAQVVNEADCGVTGYTKKLLTKNNGTPVLTRPQHRMYHTPAYTEVDVDVHVFSLVARTGIHALVDKTAGMLIDVAFVLQGESEDELPEQVLGVCRLVRVDLSKAAHVADVAARSCGREDA
ncbi:hypothetical protein DYB26_014766, partial [Aphanomyces astaci]